MSSLGRTHQAYVQPRSGRKRFFFKSSEYVSPGGVHPWLRHYSLGPHRHGYLLFSLSNIWRWWSHCPLRCSSSSLVVSYYSSKISKGLAFLNTLHQWVSVKMVVLRAGCRVVLHPRADMRRVGRIITCHGLNALLSLTWAEMTVLWPLYKAAMPPLLLW